jgi:hypothetical protein
MSNKYNDVIYETDGINPIYVDYATGEVWQKGKPRGSIMLPELVVGGPGYNYKNSNIGKLYSKDKPINQVYPEVQLIPGIGIPRAVINLNRLGRTTSKLSKQFINAAERGKQNILNYLNSPNYLNRAKSVINRNSNSMLNNLQFKTLYKKSVNDLDNAFINYVDDLHGAQGSYIPGSDYINLFNNTKTPRHISEHEFSHLTDNIITRKFNSKLDIRANDNANIITDGITDTSFRDYLSSPTELRARFLPTIMNMEKDGFNLGYEGFKQYLKKRIQDANANQINKYFNPEDIDRGLKYIIGLGVPSGIYLNNNKNDTKRYK